MYSDLLLPHLQREMIENYFEIVQGASKCTFPVLVTNRCNASVRIHLATLEHLLKEVINPQINTNKTVKLRFIFLDGKGNKYKKIIRV